MTETDTQRKDTSVRIVEEHQRPKGRPVVILARLQRPRRLTEVVNFMVNRGGDCRPRPVNGEGAGAAVCLIQSGVCSFGNRRNHWPHVVSNLLVRPTKRFVLRYEKPPPLPSMYLVYKYLPIEPFSGLSMFLNCLYDLAKNTFFWFILVYKSWCLTFSWIVSWKS